METYQGVKFSFRQLENQCPAHPLLQRLNYWSYLFAQLGLAPVHSSGAYGNQSFRTTENHFVITKTSMHPVEELDTSNYTLVEGFDTAANAFVTRGVSPPSSECFLHYDIYTTDNTVGAVLHGHSLLLNQHAEELNIPITSQFHDYGTRELAQSALAVLVEGHRFFILKNHGFVAVGDTLERAGQLTLEYYSRLLAWLRTHNSSA